MRPFTFPNWLFLSSQIGIMYVLTLDSTIHKLMNLFWRTHLVIVSVNILSYLLLNLYIKLRYLRRFTYIYGFGKPLSISENIATTKSNIHSIIEKAITSTELGLLTGRRKKFKTYFWLCTCLIFWIRNSI